jgi:predicted AAA+ superfamily ATPase
MPKLFLILLVVGCVGCASSVQIVELQKDQLFFPSPYKVAKVFRTKQHIEKKDIIKIYLTPTETVFLLKPEDNFVPKKGKKFICQDDYCWSDPWCYGDTCISEDK